MNGDAPQEITLLEGILGVANLRCIEPSFADLIDDSFTEWLEEIPADEGRMLIDEDDDPLAFAFHTEQGWLMGSFHLREPTLALIEHFEEIPGRYSKKRGKFSKMPSGNTTAWTLPGTSPLPSRTSIPRGSRKSAISSPNTGGREGFPPALTAAADLASVLSS